MSPGIPGKEFNHMNGLSKGRGNGDGKRNEHATLFLYVRLITTTANTQTSIDGDSGRQGIVESSTMRVYIDKLKR